MFIDGVVRKYFEFALEELDSEVAKEIFAVAQRCWQLRVKNQRLKLLAKRAELLADDELSTRNLRRSRFPQTWTPEFETGWKAYFLRTACSIRNYESRRKLECGADDVFMLEAQNRTIREALDRVFDQYAADERWGNWLKEYDVEKGQQNECRCCGMGCHTCPTCREYFDKTSPITGDCTDDDVRSTVRVA